MEAALNDVVLVEIGDVEASAGPALQSMDDLEIRAEDLPTDENLDRTLDPFYVADKRLYEAAHNPGISFTQLLSETRSRALHWIMMPWQPAMCLWILSAFRWACLAALGAQHLILRH